MSLALVRGFWPKCLMLAPIAKPHYKMQMLKLILLSSLTIYMTATSVFDKTQGLAMAAPASKTKPASAAAASAGASAALPSAALAPTASPALAAATSAPISALTAKFYAIRLRPEQDVIAELNAFINAHHIEAASIVSAVGSLTEVSIRYADKPSSTALKGHYEVVSLSGLISTSGKHLHISVSDGSGKTIGGHLSGKSKVYTTLEIILAEYKGVQFLRELDDTKTGGSGYHELVVAPKK